MSSLLAKKGLLFLCLSAFTFVNCEDIESTGPLTEEDLILGNWKLQTAAIDGEDQPITVPGLGQIEIVVSDESYTFTYPELNSNNFPTGETESISGQWNLNLADSTLVLYQYEEGNSTAIKDSVEWNINMLTFGYLHTDFWFRPSENLQLNYYDLVFVPGK
jgi:hypothetical protein